MRMFLAVRPDDRDGDPIGYDALTVRASGATWDMGSRVGEMESLAVKASQRGNGVGGALIAAAARRCEAKASSIWGVGVVEANEVRPGSTNGPDFGPTTGS
jgi:GNAT superfamily N-acetyltransferase